MWRLWVFRRRARPRPRNARRVPVTLFWARPLGTSIRIIVIAASSPPTNAARLASWSMIGERQNSFLHSSSGRASYSSFGMSCETSTSSVVHRLGVVELGERDERTPSGTGGGVDRARIDRRRADGADSANPSRRERTGPGLVERPGPRRRHAEARKVRLGLLRERRADPLAAPARVHGDHEVRVPARRATIRGRPSPSRRSRRPPPRRTSGAPHVRASSSEWRIPSAVTIESGHARWRSAAACGTSSRFASRITGSKTLVDLGCSTRLVVTEVIDSDELCSAETPSEGPRRASTLAVTANGSSTRAGRSSRRGRCLG